VRRHILIAAGLLFVFHVGSAIAALWKVKPFPAEGLGATLKVDNGELSSWSLASGNYIAKNGQIVVFNYFGGPQNPVANSILGNLVDLAYQNGKAKHYAPLVDGITVDLRPATQAAVSEQVVPMLRGHGSPTDDTLTISPFAYFVQEQPGMFRIRVLLRATLTDKGGKKLWKNDYYCPATEVRPLEGDESWFAQDRYQQAATEAIGRIAPVLGQDLLGELTPQRTVLMGAGRTWNTYFEFPAAILEENDDWLVVRDDPNGGKKLAADVDLIDRSHANIKPWGK
jgi:hypothetical protein